MDYFRLMVTAEGGGPFVHRRLDLSVGDILLTALVIWWKHLTMR